MSLHLGQVSGGLGHSEQSSWTGGFLSPTTLGEGQIYIHAEPLCHRNVATNVGTKVATNVATKCQCNVSTKWL